MKIGRVGEAGQERPCVFDAQGLARDVSSLVGDFTPETLDHSLLERLQEVNLSACAVIPVDRIGPPISTPRNIFAIGLNYSDHAAESNLPIPEEPILFSKATSAFCGPNDSTPYASDMRELDWEVELGVVIGKPAQHVSVEQALDHVFGYVLVNDVSERVWQHKRSGQWSKGKSYTNFCPTGPWLVTADEISDPQNLAMWLDVNGERQQTGNTDKMIFTVAQIVSHLSQFFRLQPGDLICTGTPPGVGAGKKPPRFLKPGDEVRLGIAGLGEQRQRVVPAAEILAL